MYTILLGIKSLSSQIICSAEVSQSKMLRIQRCCSVAAPPPLVCIFEAAARRGHEHGTPNLYKLRFKAFCSHLFLKYVVFTLFHSPFMLRTLLICVCVVVMGLLFYEQCCFINVTY